MGITKRSIYRLAITNLIVIGLFGCSSTPAPWTQQDASWESDNETSQNSSATTEDKAQSDTAQQAKVTQQTSAVVVVPAAVDQDATTDGIMGMMSTNYAVQVYAANTANSVEKFKSSKGLADLMTVKTERSGSVVYVLVDIQTDRAAANVAAAELEIKTGSKPWVRSLAGLQKIAVP